ncbi:MAG: GNAT family N-acetyltransferase [Pseudomonadota bacterium]
MPGEAVEYTITYLEMAAPPGEMPPQPEGDISILRADNAPLHYFLYLYGTVGAAYAWTDWFERPHAEQLAFVEDPGTSIHTLMLEGWPAGFFMLDTRRAGLCDLAYFGLMPEAVGRGLGFWFLSRAVEAAWQQPKVEKLTVNTCTLDHPVALTLYERRGFVPVRREVARRTGMGTRQAG